FGRRVGVVWTGVESSWVALGGVVDRHLTMTCGSSLVGLLVTRYCRVDIGVTVEGGPFFPTSSSLLFSSFLSSTSALCPWRSLRCVVQCCVTLLRLLLIYPSFLPSLPSFFPSFLSSPRVFFRLHNSTLYLPLFFTLLCLITRCA
ncbi:hypothetical protein CPB84DRAFT_1790367, partial [Gymnopilus junonius]